MMSARVFVSYRRDDNPDFVNRIRDHLIGRFGRDNVFMDFDAIPPAAKFKEYIREEVVRCDAFVVIIGPRWLEILRQKAADFQEDFVRYEIELALEHKKFIMPICIKGASPPDVRFLPDSMKSLLESNIAFLNSDRGFYDEILRIIDAIEVHHKTLLEKARTADDMVVLSPQLYARLKTSVGLGDEAVSIEKLVEIIVSRLAPRLGLDGSAGDLDALVEYTVSGLVQQTAPEAQTRIFMSYRHSPLNHAAAQAIRDFLVSENYDVWMDTASITGGQEWSTQIYDAITNSDLLLLLLTPDTAESDWVRREIDVARGARLQILPVLIHDSPKEIRTVLKRLDLPGEPLLSFTEDSQAERSKLLQIIETIKQRTPERGSVFFDQQTRSVAELKQPHIQTNQSFASYTIPDQTIDCKIHLAAGDMTRMRGIDVLVNSENSYMQMERVFNTASLSSRLRLMGSLLNRSGDIVEDSVQEELYEQIKHGYPIPIRMGVVVPTHAGRPESRLAKSGARYIFHAATLNVAPNSRQPARPLDKADIASAVFNCLGEVRTINDARGVISPPGSQRREQEERQADQYQPIQSIIFPLFGTGDGGYPVTDSALQMLEAIRDFLTDSENTEGCTLKAIHLCAYLQQDVYVLKALMDTFFAS